MDKQKKPKRTRTAKTTRAAKSAKTTKAPKLRCPECGSSNLVCNGKQVIDRRKKQRYLCNNCYRVTTKPLGLEGGS